MWMVTVIAINTKKMRRNNNFTIKMIEKRIVTHSRETEMIFVDKGMD